MAFSTALSLNLLPLMHSPCPPGSDLHLAIMANERPSKQTFHWPRHGRYNEFPSITTSPQQDVSESKQATKIHAVTDKRAQPIHELVQANIHDHKVRTLPPKTASKKEVKEFLFFVLGCERLSSIAGQASQAVTTTVALCKLDGQGLRDAFTNGLWDKLCPARW
jgi:hypothetical protein